MEESLRRLNIKYKIIGGLSFYQRKEIKDLLAYMRFVLNQNDEASFRRIINLPKRGIGDSTVDKIIIAANDHGISIWEVIQNAGSLLGGRAAGPIEDFVNMIKRFALRLNVKMRTTRPLKLPKGRVAS
jgi:DNA helicase-2/ATP-dependent DNA helicase PcrA